MWAALFPGQGSQNVGMGKVFYENFTVAKRLFEEASDTLSLDFKKLCFEGPDDQLALTENTQPALLLVSTCADRVMRETLGLEIKAAAGHSIGEYAAVVSADSVRFADALIAVRARGKAMQSAVPVGKGAMLAALGLEDEQVEELCKMAQAKSGLAGTIEPANFNSPGQVVISGHKTMADWILSNVKSDDFSQPPRRMKFIPLNVSAPFHCSLMQPAEAQMRPVLEGIEFKKAAFPVIQNVSAEAVEAAEVLRENLIQQITAPVQWVRCVRTLVNMGVDKCIELGSGKVLQGLVKKIDSEHLNTFNIQGLEDIKALEAESKN